ncbi:uncharacterized protein LOC143286730 [Babylonia areolata]|uniref:uncharacterized protein LOC143286730 n=1 Tax=Babylonia areolata TaxID=304850 RepID=UPI003FD1591B
MTEEEHCLVFEYFLSPVSESRRTNELHVWLMDESDTQDILFSADSNSAVGWRSAYIPVRKRGNNFKILIQGSRNTVPSSSLIFLDDLQYRRQPCPSAAIPTTTTTTPTNITTTTTTPTNITNTTGSVSTTASSDDSSDILLSLVIGLVIAAVLTIATGVMLYCCRKQRKVQKRTSNTNDNESRTGGSGEPVASASSGPHEEDGYSTVDDISTPSTSAAAPTFSKSRSVVVQRVKAKPVPASTRLLADSQTFSLLKQRCEPTTGEEDYNTLTLHHGQTPQETATKTGRELLYNHLDSVRVQA